MGDLFWNKIAAAVLAILLVVMGLREISSIVFHTEAPSELAYPVDMSALEVAGEAEEEAGPVDFGTLLAAASAADGERVARRCTACHTFEQGGGHGTGPAMYGVLGRQVASVSGFSYSSAMREYAEGGTEWLYQNMYEYLENPRRYVPGTSMAFAGLRSQDDRINLLAYMRQQDDNPPPLPEPLPTGRSRADRHRRARAQHGDRDSGAPGLSSQSVAVGQDERLGGPVARLARHRLEGCRGGDVENGSGPALDHAREEQAAQVDHGFDVGPHELDLSLRVAVVHRAERPHSGVVDQHVHRQPAPGDLLDELAASLRVGQIGRQGLRADTVLLLQFGGQVP
jgi:cytochrome c